MIEMDEIIKQLRSGNTKHILKALKVLRENGSVQIIPEVIDILNKDIDYTLKREIIEFLSGIKDKRAVPYIVNSIKKVNNKHNLSDLLSVCWQSALDFSDYVLQFTEVFIIEDYHSALEAFTVIEEFIYKSNKKEVQKCLALLTASIEDIHKDKQALSRELIKILNTELSYI